MLTLAALNNIVPALVVVVFVIVSIVLVLTILVQRPQGGGLSSAFGAGGGSGQTAFGAKTGDALTLATILIFVTYLGVAIVLNYMVRPPTGLDDAPAIVAGDEIPLDAGAAPALADTIDEGAITTIDSPSEDAEATDEVFEDIPGALFPNETETPPANDLNLPSSATDSEPASDEGGIE